MAEAHLTQSRIPHAKSQDNCGWGTESQVFFNDNDNKTPVKNHEDNLLYYSSCPRNCFIFLRRKIKIISVCRMKFRFIFILVLYHENAKITLIKIRQEEGKLGGGMCNETNTFFSLTMHCFKVSMNIPNISIKVAETDFLNN